MFRESQTRAQEAIKKFCKINLLDSMINDFQQYKNKKGKKVHNQEIFKVE